MTALGATSASLRPAHARFELTSRELDGRLVRLGYRLAGGPDPDVELVEELELPEQIPAPSSEDPVVEALLDGLHRAFGVSYFKVCAPSVIVAPPTTHADAAFWDTVYGEGMGEFWYRNGLDPERRGRFPVGAEEPVRVALPPRQERALILAGGGKDSAVACEIVRAAAVPADAFSLGEHAWIARSVEPMGLRHLVARRRIDPRLRELNQRGAYNGHVPISACIAFVAQLVAHLGGHDVVVAANERSADEGNLRWHGIEVNHQWSKTLGFERAFQAWWDRRFDGGPRYFSILRPLSELRIARELSRHPQHFEHFTSCNTNFRLSAQNAPVRWCGRCPKCVFVAVVLAPHLSDAEISRVFGRDLLAEPENRPMLEALVGLSGHKPFECVGTADECVAALVRLRDSGRLPRALDGLVEEASRTRGSEASWERAMAISGDHAMPERWEARVYAYLGAG